MAALGLWPPPVRHAHTLAQEQLPSPGLWIFQENWCNPILTVTLQVWTVQQRDGISGRSGKASLRRRPLTQAEVSLACSGRPLHIAPGVGAWGGQRLGAAERGLTRGPCAQRKPAGFTLKLTRVAPTAPSGPLGSQPTVQGRTNSTPPSQPCLHHSRLQEEGFEGRRGRPLLGPLGGGRRGLGPPH